MLLSSMENFPDEIVLDILSRLPAESVLNCKLVNKYWLTLFRSTPCFADMHLRRLELLRLDDVNDDNNNHHSTDVGCLASNSANKFGSGFGMLLAIGGYHGDCEKTWLYYGDYNDVKPDRDSADRFSYKELKRINHPPVTCEDEVFVGSCNGLVCINVKNHGIGDPVYIYNPITSEYVYLPGFSLRSQPGNEIRAGFGYLPSTDEYKIVRIWYLRGSSTGLVQVYTLGDGNGWRNKGRFTDVLAPWPGVLADGALHWLDGKEGQKIVAFDLKDEEILYLPSPPLCFRKGHLKCSKKLVALGGSLCFTNQVRGAKYELEVWSVTKKNSVNFCGLRGVKYYSSSWTKMFTIVQERYTPYDIYSPFALTKSGKVLLWHTDALILSCYDPKTATLKQLVEDDGVEVEQAQAILHVNSLVSLKAIGEKRAKIRRNFDRPPKQLKKERTAGRKWHGT